MDTIALKAHDGMRGFDCNTVLSFDVAKTFATFKLDGGKQAFEFVGRYIPRLVQHKNDLTHTEILDIFNAGLALFPIQHCEPGYWTPSESKGELYGKNAVKACMDMAIAPTVCVGLDLESISSNVKKDVILAYCNTWYDIVNDAGYTPMIYLGWGNGLSGSDAYHHLKFEHYWGSYNLNLDQYPSVRSIQMKQLEAHAEDIPLGIGFTIDIDVIMQDKLGGLPILYAQA